MVTFSDPRLVAEFDDWPCGGHRVKCVFRVHRDKRGFRVERRTTNKAGVWCKPKFTNYSGQAAIVDGSDGRTYILQLSAGYGFIVVWGSDFMNPPESQLGFHHAVFPDTNPERHAELIALIVQGQSMLMEVAK